MVVKLVSAFQNLILVDPIVPPFMLFIGLIIGFTFVIIGWMLSPQARTFILAKLFKSPIVQIFDPSGRISFKRLEKSQKEGQFVVAGAKKLDDTQMFIRPYVSDAPFHKNYYTDDGTPMFHALDGKSVLATPAYALAIHCVENRSNLTPELEEWAKKQNITIMEEEIQPVMVKDTQGNNVQYSITDKDGNKIPQYQKVKVPKVHSLHTIDPQQFKLYFNEWYDSTELTNSIQDAYNAGYAAGVGFRSDNPANAKGGSKLMMWLLIGGMVAGIAILAIVYLMSGG